MESFTSIFMNDQMLFIGEDELGLFTQKMYEYILGRIERRKMITEHDIENWFTYHAPKDNQSVRYQQLRNKAKELALLILNNTKPSADQTAAIHKLRECVMTANAAIACEE